MRRNNTQNNSITSRKLRFIAKILKKMNDNACQYAWSCFHNAVQQSKEWVVRLSFEFQTQKTDFIIFTIHNNLLYCFKPPLHSWMKQFTGFFQHLKYREHILGLALACGTILVIGSKIGEITIMILSIYSLIKKNILKVVLFIFLWNCCIKYQGLADIDVLWYKGLWM